MSKKTIVPDCTDMKQQSTPGTAAEPPLIPERVLRFMNALPTTEDVVQWIMQFRESLQGLLGDVDRIACSVNIFCDLQRPAKYRPWMYFGMYMKAGAEMELPQVHDMSALPIARRLFTDLHRLYREIDDYQPPVAYEYYIPGGAYLGCLLLFRRKGLTPISERTLQTMGSLEPFFLFAFSGLVARRSMVTPVDRVFNQVLTRIQVGARLSEHEWQVMALQIMGLSYAQIARQLFLSEHTIAKYVKSAHRKTGCYSFLELFAPYFREAVRESEG